MKFKAGDVLSYTPKGGTWARESTAFVREVIHEHHFHAGEEQCRCGLRRDEVDSERSVRLVPVDTYWHTFAEGGDSYVLSDEELEGASVVFNVNDFDALDFYSRSSRETWMTYAPGDRARITMQHGLQERLFTRKGASPDHATMVKNAKDAVEAAEHDARSAEQRLERRRADLAELEGAPVS